MRYHFCLLFLLLATWLSLCNSKFVDPLATDILPSTRIVGTVSLFKKICENDAVISDIVCEFVDVDKGAYGELTKKNLDSQVKAIKDASVFYEKTSTVGAKNLDKTLEGFGMLTGLKEHEANLKEEFITDAEETIKKGISVSTDIMSNDRNIPKKTFAKIQEILKYIDSNTVDDSNKDEVDEKLDSLRTRVVVLRKSLKAIQNYQKEYADFLSLKDMDKKTKVAIEVVQRIKNIFDNFEAIKVFDSIAPALKEQMSKLNTEIGQFEKHANTLTSVESSIQIVNRLSASRSKKSLTRGLPNGAADMKRLTKDLESSWFTKNFVNGGDTKSIQDFLPTVSNVSNLLDFAQKHRSGFFIDQEIQKDYSEFTIEANKLVDVGKRATQNQNGESALKSMVPCVQMMTTITTVPELKNTEDVANYVKAVVKLIADFETVAKEVNSQKDLTNFQNSLGKLIQVSNKIGNSPTLNETVKTCEDIRNLKLLTTYDNIWKTLQKFSESPFYLKQEDLPTHILKEALNSAKDANIFKAVECLPTTATSISDVISFGKKFDELKTEQSKLTSVVTSLTNALVFSNSASKTVSILKKSKSQDETKFICDLPENFTKEVKPFVMVGEFINDLAKIERSGAAIQLVTNPNDEVKSEVEKISGSDFYNDDFRKILADSWKIVKESFKSISPVRDYEGLMKTIGVLVSKVKKVAVKDLRKLKHPIAVELSQNSDPKIKEASKSFETVSELNLDFASYSSELVLENNLVKSLSLIFVKSSTKQEAVSNGIDFKSPEAIAVISAVSLIVLVCIILFFCWCRKLCCFKNKDDKNDDIEGQTGGKNRRSRKKGPKTKKGNTKRSKSVSKSSEDNSKMSKTDSKGNKNDSKGSKSDPKGGKGNPKGDKDGSNANNGGSKGGKDGSKDGKDGSKGDENRTKKGGGGSKGGKSASKGSKGGSKQDKDGSKKRNKKMKKTSWYGNVINFLRKIVRWKKPEPEPVEYIEENQPISLGFANRIEHFGGLKPNRKLEESRRSKKDWSEKEESMKKILTNFQIQLQKLREHAKKVKEEHLRDTDPKNFKKMGSIFILAEPGIPKKAAVLPDNIVLKSVRYYPDGNEWWEIGSDVDDIELYSDFKIEDVLTSSECESFIYTLQDTQSYESSIKSKKDIEFPLKKNETVVIDQPKTVATPPVSSVVIATSPGQDIANMETAIPFDQPDVTPASVPTPSIPTTPPASLAPSGESASSSVSNVPSELPTPSASNEQQ